MSTSPFELAPAPLLIDAYDVLELTQEIERLGFKLIFSPQTPTTMSTVDEHALSGDASNIVALTDHQTNGVGREGRAWHDSPGKSVLMSIRLNPDESSLTTYADLVALNACQTLRELSGLPIQLKWPNDIVYEDKKLGGILTRAIYDDQNKFLGANVGIGINVHQEKSELPPSDYGAVSLDILQTNPVSRKNLVLGILSNIADIGPDAEIIQTNPAARETYDELWQKLSSVLGRDVEVTHGENTTIGRAIEAKIGLGLRVETSKGLVVFNQFNTNMKVRII